MWLRASGLQLCWLTEVQPAHSPHPRGAAQPTEYVPRHAIQTSPVSMSDLTITDLMNGESVCDYSALQAEKYG